MKAVVFNLGCKVNECESNSILFGFKEKGYEVSDKLEYADIYVVNTCAVTKEAEKKSRQMFARINKLNPKAKIIFSGCACQKDAKAFSRKSKNCVVTGVFDKKKIFDLADANGEYLSDNSREYEELPIEKSLKTRTFIKVQDGCDNFCTYCIIPYLRGRSRSRNPQSVLDEIGIISPKEAVITGINLSAYNYDGNGLSGLMEKLKDIECRIRLGSLEVNVITERFLNTLTNLKNFAPHFHLSLQSGSNSVLKKMNRHYTVDEYMEKCCLIRKIFPDAGITTDIIVGFPTETEKDFCDTLQLIDKVKFSDIHPFIYSPREWTVAYKMRDLPFEVKKARLDILIECKRKCKKSFVNFMAGKTEEVLFEIFKNGFSQGYTKNYLRVYVKDNIAGNERKVKIIKGYKDGAIAELV